MHCYSHTRTHTHTKIMANIQQQIIHRARHIQIKQKTEITTKKCQQRYGSSDFSFLPVVRRLKIMIEMVVGVVCILFCLITMSMDKNNNKKNFQFTYRITNLMIRC